LQQSERSNLRGAPAILDVRRNLALQPNAVRHRCQQDADDGRRLDDRDNDESSYAQRLSVWKRAFCPRAFDPVLRFWFRISYYVSS